MAESFLNIRHVNKIYGQGTRRVHAVRNLDMDAAKGEIVALLGSSGCGKTSTLRMIAGFEALSSGTIHLNGRAIHTLPPAQRGVAMAFEGYSLYPTVSLRENISFALEASRLDAKVTAARVAEIASMLEISDILERFPVSLSGGQQQRASLARALVRDADLCLLDEPMGQLEPQLRTRLRGRIKHYIRERGLSVILVTHDQTEANALADRIAVMEDGVLRHYADPTEIREYPADMFTGTFIGEPPMNVLEAIPDHRDGLISFNLGAEVVLRYPDTAFDSDAIAILLSRRKIAIGIRPHALKRDPEGFPATISANQWLGDQTHIAADFASRLVVLVEHDYTPFVIGDQIRLSLAPEDMHIFDFSDGKALIHGGVTAKHD